ncbi:hypothetical protein BDZ89DRAFT_1133800 [Hymenopellis radicata]|nr:hypothetical protein BDZ89DRAFT_1133800 [Hymenopellis radicata]
MATPSRLSYADLAKKNITARSPNDVQRTSTSTATTTTTTASSVSPPLSKAPSTVTTPSSSAILVPRPSSPPLDAASNDAKTIWDIRKEQLNGRQTRSSIPSTSQNSLNGSITDDDDPFVVRMPQRPAVPLNDVESWPAVGKSISTPSVATTPPTASQTGTPPRKSASFVLADDRFLMIFRRKKMGADSPRRDASRSRRPTSTTDKFSLAKSVSFALSIAPTTKYPWWLNIWFPAPQPSEFACSKPNIESESAARQALTR